LELLRHKHPQLAARQARVLSSNVAWLIVGTLGSQALANSAPLLVKLRGTASPAETAQFFATLLVARLPLFAFAAVQAVLLPALARALGSGDTPAFRGSLRRVEMAVLALGGAAVAGAAVLGVPLVHLVFGPDYVLGRNELVLLAAGTIIYIAANVQAQAALALGRHRRVATAWALGCGIAVVVSLAPGEVRTLIAVSFAAGSAAALAALATTVRRALHQRDAPSIATRSS
jgi:O-antigen/teichoic acid export membrane protein